jgi:hypothetical protein
MCNICQTINSTASRNAGLPRQQRSREVKGFHNEKNISAQQNQARPKTRIFKTNVNQSGKENYKSAPGQRQKPVGSVTLARLGASLK